MSRWKRNLTPYVCGVRGSEITKRGGTLGLLVSKLTGFWRQTEYQSQSWFAEEKSGVNMCRVHREGPGTQGVLPQCTYHSAPGSDDIFVQPSSACI